MVLSIHPVLARGAVFFRQHLLHGRKLPLMIRASRLNKGVRCIKTTRGEMDLEMGDLESGKLAAIEAEQITGGFLLIESSESLRWELLFHHFRRSAERDVEKSVNLRLIRLSQTESGR